MMDANAAAVAEVVAGIYRSAYDGTEWAETIERLRRLFHGSKACLVRAGPDMTAADTIAANADPVYQDAFVTDFMHEPNVLEEAIGAAPVGLVYADHALVGPDRLRGSRLWNDWMAPQDMYGGIACKLLERGPSSWFFDVQRGRTQAAFTAGDLDLLAFLAPHIRRSIEIGQKLHIKQAIGAAGASLSFGIVIVDPNLRVLGANEAAKAILGTAGSPISAWNGRLRGAPRVLETLARLVRDACKIGPGGTAGVGGDFVAHAKEAAEGAADLAVSVSASMTRDKGPPGIACNAVLLIRDLSLKMPAAFEAHARGAFDLTPKEAQVAAALAAGLSLKQVAEKRGIAITTARTHLDRIFRKTATSQQSELVALLKTLQPLGGA